MSTLSYPERLRVEQRLLAALYLWPRPVELDAHHFLSLVHGALFSALQDAGTALLDDTKALAVLRALLVRDEVLDVFACVGGLDNYVIEQLVPMAVTEHAIVDLVEQVRACPRCGR